MTRVHHHHPTHPSRPRKENGGTNKGKWRTRRHHHHHHHPSPSQHPQTPPNQEHQGGTSPESTNTTSSGRISLDLQQHQEAAPLKLCKNCHIQITLRSNQTMCYCTPELPLLTNCSAGLGQDLGRTNQKLGRTSRTFGNSAGHFEKKNKKNLKCLKML